MIQEDARANSVLGISFMLYQAQTALSVYEEYKSVKQLHLKLLQENLVSAQERTVDNLESEERDFKKETDAASKLFQILDPRIAFLKGVLRHYEHVLQSYAKSGLFSEFENLESCQVVTVLSEYSVRINSVEIYLC